MVSSNSTSPIMAKVADFGTTIPLCIPELRSRLVDQPLWLAPEVRPTDKIKNLFCS